MLHRLQLYEDEITWNWSLLLAKPLPVPLSSSLESFFIVSIVNNYLTIQNKLEGNDPIMVLLPLKLIVGIHVQSHWSQQGYISWTTLRLNGPVLITIVTNFSSSYYLRSGYVASALQHYIETAVKKRILNCDEENFQIGMKMSLVCKTLKHKIYQCKTKKVLALLTRRGVIPC